MLSFTRAPVQLRFTKRDCSFFQSQAQANEHTTTAKAIQYANGQSCRKSKWSEDNQHLHFLKDKNPPDSGSFFCVTNF